MGFCFYAMSFHRIMNISLFSPSGQPYLEPPVGKFFHPGFKRNTALVGGEIKENVHSAVKFAPKLMLLTAFPHLCACMHTERKPDLSVIIPTVGRGEILQRTLDALFKAISGYAIQVILVDDTREGQLGPYDFPMEILQSGGIGASGARNLGWRHAKSDLLLFLDDDIVIEAAHIRRTLELHQLPSANAYNFFWVYPPELMEELPKSKFGKYALDHQLYSNAHRLAYRSAPADGLVIENGLTSQYFSIEKRWIEKVNGYDSIPFAGIEDLLLYKKLKAVGVLVFLSHKDIVHQNESNRLNISSLVRRYRTGALTRRIAAVHMGHTEMGVQFGKGDQFKASCGFLLLPASRVITYVLPYGVLYQKAVNYQLFMGTYKGYYKDKLPRDFSERFK